MEVTPRPGRGLLGEGELHDVQSHSGGRFALLGGVVMDLLVLEAIAEVRVERKEYNQPSVPNNAKRLGWTAIVLVDLGQTVRELVKRMKNGVREGELDER